MNSFQFLGTGASLGVPVIGCRCKVCSSTDQRDVRLRSANLLTLEGKKILLDVGTDYRFQALKYHINTIDGVILTHAHHDHTAGVDELRVYKTARPLPFLFSSATFDEMKLRYAYIFSERMGDKSMPDVVTQLLDGDRGSTEFLGIKLCYTTFYQGGMKVLGVRFGDFAYLSDIREYPETIFEDLLGVKKLVISALRHLPTSMHFSLGEAIEFSKKIKAEETWLTHISHDLGHEETLPYLPANVRMAYDGLILSIN